MTELKPCPFCGNDAEYVRTDDDQYWIRCSNEYNCSIEQRELFTLEEAIKKWNTRIKLE